MREKSERVFLFGVFFFFLFVSVCSVVISIAIRLLLGYDVTAFHVTDQLGRYFGQHFAGQVRFGVGRVLDLLKVLKRHELHNVPGGAHPVHFQRHRVTVQFFHRLEIRVAHAHDNDGQR